MNEYLASFYTHFAAICTARALTRIGVKAELMPVPRAISASCGTCVRYLANDPCLEQMAKDVECVYLVSDAKFEMVRQFE